MRAKSLASFGLILMSLSLTGCMSPATWWQRVNARARELSTMRERHAILEAEYQSLRMKFLELEHEHHSLKAELEMERAKRENKRIAGDEEGRHLANIVFTVPAHVSIEERAKLAAQHVVQGKFQEAFALFESFLWVPEGARQQTVTAFYDAGVAAFEIKNFNRAREYFEAASAHGDGLRDTETLRRTKLWLRVLDKRANGAPKDGRKVASH